MSLISKREQDFLSNWAKNAECRMTEKPDGAESYFEKRTNESTYLMEYTFDTASEMDEMIMRVLGDRLDPKLRKVCEVAAYKEGNRQPEENENEQEKAVIPEFIYQF